MQKIGDVTDTATANGEFTDGSVASGISPTLLLAAIFNTWQRELCNVVTGSGAELDPANDGQILEAIQSIVSEAVSAAITPTIPDIGELYFTTDLTDPNVKYPGTTWEYLGEGLTLRTAKVDGSDMNAIVGADSTMLTVDNMPTHAHGITGGTGSSTDTTMTTSSFDYGSKGSDNPGDHVHTETHANPDDPATVYLRTDGLSAGYSTINTGAGGNHGHSTAIGAHNHTGDIPAHSHTLPVATDGVGAGTAISLLQKSINVAIWVRVA